MSITPQKSLEDLLSHLFTVQELRKFARDGDEGQDIVLSLPDTPASVSEVSCAYVGQLSRRGLIDDKLFERIVTLRRRRVNEIRRVQVAFPNMAEATRCLEASEALRGERPPSSKVSDRVPVLLVLALMLTALSIAIWVYAIGDTGAPNLRTTEKQGTSRSTLHPAATPTAQPPAPPVDLATGEDAAPKENTPVPSVSQHAETPSAPTKPKSTSKGKLTTSDSQQIENSQLNSEDVAQALNVSNGDQPAFVPIVYLTDSIQNHDFAYTGIEWGFHIDPKGEDETSWYTNRGRPPGVVPKISFNSEWATIPANFIVVDFHISNKAGNDIYLDRFSVEVLEWHAVQAAHTFWNMWMPIIPQHQCNATLTRQRQTVPLACETREGIVSVGDDAEHFSAKISADVMAPYTVAAFQIVGLFHDAEGRSYQVSSDKVYLLASISRNRYK